LSLRSKSFWPKLLFLIISALMQVRPAAAEKPEKIRLAVEFVDHAACAHIAANQGWYGRAGLNVEIHDTFVTGMALGAALCRGDIDAAYVCLFPAINARANAKLPLKIVAGTHLYGYGLVVNPDRVKKIKDLAEPDMLIGCTREGSPADVLLHRLAAAYGFGDKFFGQVRRMSPPKMLLAMQSDRIDAAFMPEQFPTMAEDSGFKQLVSAADLWPGMQGSVLVVTEGFLQSRPDAVRKLVELTESGIEFIDENPGLAAEIVSSQLNAAGKKVFPESLSQDGQNLAISPSVIRRSLGKKLENTWKISPSAVQEAIDEAAKLGYIRKSFAAGEMLDLRFLNQ